MGNNGVKHYRSQGGTTYRTDHDFRSRSASACYCSHTRSLFLRRTPLYQIFDRNNHNPDCCDYHCHAPKRKKAHLIVLLQACLKATEKILRGDLGKISIGISSHTKFSKKLRHHGYVFHSFRGHFYAIIV